MIVFVALAATELFVISYLFYFPVALGEWANPVSYAKKSVQAAVITTLAFCLIAWPRRGEILGCWNDLAASQRWKLAVAANLVLFTLLALAAVWFSRYASTADEPPWRWFAAFYCLLLVNAGSLALLAAPMSFWTKLPRLAGLEMLLALGSAAFVLLAAEISRSGWASLSSATLSVAAWLLSLYESDMAVDVARKVLSVGDFSVIVTPECSGYEGIGLVTAFLTLYLWVFRRELLFPNALLLLPIGICAIWFLNALRIAALVSIGAHLSPAVATDGFHSQAGWIAFVAVTLALITVAHKSSYFHRQASHSASTADPSARVLYAYLLPFIALMASSIMASAFAPNDQWLYSLKVIAVGVVVWIFRDVYSRLASGVSLLSIGVGLAVGLVWVATDPLKDQPSTLGAWLAALPPTLAILWIASRALGSVFLVPIAEELAFRGYLHRALISRRFETVDQGQFTWLAFVVSTILFGAVHQRWLAAIVAGAAYALLMYRTGRLSDPIAAHMASNAVIIFWALVAGQWSLL